MHRWFVAFDQLVLSPATGMKIGVGVGLPRSSSPTLLIDPADRRFSQVPRGTKLRDSKPGPSDPPVRMQSTRTP